MTVLRTGPEGSEAKGYREAAKPINEPEPFPGYIRIRAKGGLDMIVPRESVVKIGTRDITYNKKQAVIVLNGHERIEQHHVIVDITEDERERLRAYIHDNKELPVQPSRITRLYIRGSIFAAIATAAALCTQHCYAHAWTVLWLFGAVVTIFSSLASAAMLTEATTFESRER